jgi:6-pyruvoyltetrahydropterin/6-carboxytetrahydropterin synthase
MIDRLLSLTTCVNGEKEVKLHSVIVHETQTGYAQAFYEDAYSKNMGIINLDEIIFSDEVKDGFGDKELWENIKKGKKFLNPKTI